MILMDEMVDVSQDYPQIKGEPSIMLKIKDGNKIVIANQASIGCMPNVRFRLSLPGSRMLTVFGKGTLVFWDWQVEGIEPRRVILHNSFLCSTTVTTY